MFGNKKVYLISMYGADIKSIKKMEKFLAENNIAGKVINQSIDIREL